MQVKEVMTRDAECTRPDATLHEAAERMKTLDVGALPVCHNDQLVGMLTDRDITVRSVSGGHDPRKDHVRDAMTPEVFWCFEDEDVTDAARLMKEKQVRRLPVLNRDKRLSGIVSLGDLAVEADDEQLVGEALEGISEPPKPKEPSKPKR
jgi:CBS domain-containing protein